MLFVRGEDAVEQRRLDINGMAMMAQRAQILGQAWTAESKARPEIGLRDIEPLVRAENIHDLARIDAVRVAHRTNLVGESDFAGMPGIAGIFDRFRRTDIDDEELAAIVAVEIV